MVAEVFSALTGRGRDPTSRRFWVHQKTLTSSPAPCLNKPEASESDSPKEAGAGKACASESAGVKAKLGKRSQMPDGLDWSEAKDDVEPKLPNSIAA